MIKFTADDIANSFDLQAHDYCIYADHQAEVAELRAKQNKVVALFNDYTFDVENGSDVEAMLTYADLADSIRALAEGSA